MLTPTILKLIRPTVAKVFFKQDEYNTVETVLKMLIIKLLIVLPNPFSQAQKTKCYQRSHLSMKFDII